MEADSQKALHELGKKERVTPSIMSDVTEAGAIHCGGARLPEVRIDDDDLIEPPSEGGGALAQVVLTVGALGVLKHLPQRRLTHVQKGVSLEVPSLYFRMGL